MSLSSFGWTPATHPARRRAALADLDGGGGEPTRVVPGRRTDDVTVLVISDNCKTCTSEC